MFHRVIRMLPVDCQFQKKYPSIVFHGIGKPIVFGNYPEVLEIVVIHRDSHLLLLKMVPEGLDAITAIPCDTECHISIINKGAQMFLRVKFTWDVYRNTDKFETEAGALYQNL